MTTLKYLSLLLAAILSGCISEHSGSTTTVGEETALPELSNASDTIKVRVFQSIKGARVWTAKDSKVEIRYKNSYTNTYFGIATFSDSMDLKVKIEPMSHGSNSNDLKRASLISAQPTATAATVHCQ